MNKKLYPLAIFAVMFLITVQMAGASFVEVGFRNPSTMNSVGTKANPISMCSEPILSDKVALFIQNVGSESDTYTLSYEAPSGWEVMLPDDVTISPSEGKVKVVPFFINPPYPWEIKSGTYLVKVTAKSRTAPSHTAIAELYVNILDCFSLDMVAQDTYKEACVEDGDKPEYRIEIANKGKWTETLDLSASESWVVFQNKRLTLEPDQKNSVIVTLNPPADFVGSKEIIITAKSATSFIEKTAKIEFKSKDCYKFNANLVPESTNSCIGESKPFKVVITNTGERTDSYTIFGSFTTLDSKKYDQIIKGIEVDSNQVKEMEIEVEPSSVGKNPFEVRVVSEKDANDAKVLQGSVIAQECRGVAVIVSPSKLSVCSGDEAAFIITLKNIGAKEDTYELTSSLGALSKNKVVVNPDETRDIKLTVDTTKMTGTKKIDIMAKSGDIQDKSTLELVIDNCFDASIDVTPKEANVCPGQTATFNIEVKNAGKKDDTYKLSYGVGTMEEKTIQINAGASKVFEYKKSIGSDEKAGTREFVAKISSTNGVSMESKGMYTVLETEKCYSAQLENGDQAEVKILKATVIPISLKNTGEMDGKWTIESSGVEWAYVEPTEMTLKSGEERKLYLYLNPPLGTKAGTYEVVVTTKSPAFETEKRIKIVVESDIGGPSNGNTQKPVEGSNTSTGGNTPANNTSSGGVKINTSTPSGGFTGSIIDNAPLWKTLIVALITFVIVIILIVRFVLLFRK